MKLVILTKPTFFVEEDKILASLFDEGLDCLHLCKPGSSPMYCERLLTLLPEDCYGKISVHDHFYLKEEYKLRGIHIDDGLLPPTGWKGHFSVTCSDLLQLKEAKRKADYVFLADVFATDNRPAAYNAESLAEASRRGLIDKRVYACGGVTLDKVRQARDMGFGGVVVGDDLWSRFDIHNGMDYRDLMAHFERLRTALG